MDASIEATWERERRGIVFAGKNRTDCTQKPDGCQTKRRRPLARMGSKKLNFLAISSPRKRAGRQIRSPLQRSLVFNTSK